MAYNGGMLRPVWAEVDLAAIRSNLQGIRGLIGQTPKIMAVVKADAYGHGGVEVAREALAAGADWLGVALLEEGIALRKAGILDPILVFGPLLKEQVELVCEFNLTTTVTVLESAQALSKEAAGRNIKAKIHVKIDTGMGRVGINPKEAGDFFRRLLTLSHLEVEGIYSHFATADEGDLSYAYHQLSVFNSVLTALRQMGINIPVRHMANSAGIINIPESYFDLVRAGIMIYGLYPSPEIDRSRIPLKPAFSLKSRITQVKRVPAGTGISYGRVYQTKKATNIITLPIGYADGWVRSLSGKAQVLVKGQRYPLVGRICMDQCMAEVGDTPVSVGEEVLLIGRQGQEGGEKELRKEKGKETRQEITQEITVDEIAAELGTINYEVVCLISNRVPRVYKRG